MNVIFLGAHTRDFAQHPRVDLCDVHVWQGPCVWTIKICFTIVHFSRSPRMDHFEVHSWTSLSSRAVEEKTRAWWPQVHKQGLHTLQTSAWEVWSDVSSVKTET
jgi:hypothetical protein